MKVLSSQPLIGRKSWNSFTVKQNGRIFKNVSEQDLVHTEQGDEALQTFWKSDPAPAPDWVQCEACDKWRYLPTDAVLMFQHKHFTCDMSKDMRGLSGCHVPQQDWNNMTEGCSWYVDKKTGEWMIHEAEYSSDEDEPLSQRAKRLRR